MAKPFMCGDEVAVYIPEGGCDCNYTLQRVEDENYAYAYKLMLNGSQVGDLITVPYDKYVSNAILATVTDPETPYAGAEIGDLYLDISFMNYPEHIYVPMKSLMSGGYQFVDALPDVGDSRYIYLVDDGHGGYDRYVWDSTNQDWIDLGSTEIDLSNYYTKTEIDGMISNIMLRMYPIGSIYVSVNNTDPGTIFGGTWEQIQDRFLLAAGSTYSAGSTGGAATVKLTAAQSGIRAHSHGHTFTIGPAGHRIRAAHVQVPGTSGAARAFPNSTSGYSENTFTDGHTISGSISQNTAADATSAHTNMPPYLTVYVWKRTA